MVPDNNLLLAGRVSDNNLLLAGGVPDNNFIHNIMQLCINYPILILYCWFLPWKNSRHHTFNRIIMFNTWEDNIVKNAANNTINIIVEINNLFHSTALLTVILNVLLCQNRKGEIRK